jgi:hypothetical protein
MLKGAPKGKAANQASGPVELASRLSADQRGQLLATLKSRFEKNMARHAHLEWADIDKKLQTSPQKLLSLGNMELTGGEPDVTGFDEETGEFLFHDCSSETPQGRKNTCYDREGQDTREKQGIHPAGNAVDMAAALGIELLSEEQYRKLQALGEFDRKTSSWILTPPELRKLGGALFCDRRYGRVFVYHNSAPSFYSSRGFRGVLRV